MCLVPCLAFRLAQLPTAQPRLSQRTSGAVGISLQTDDPFVINLALGGIAGAISNVLIFPADLVKTKMQSAKTDQSKNAWETAQAVVATEGFSGLWAGSIPVLLGSAPESSIQLACHAWLIAALMAGTGHHAEVDLRVSSQLFAASIAGAATIFVTNPMEMLRIKASMSPGRSVLDNARALGLPGLFAGWDSTWFRDIPFSCIYFLLYCHLKVALTPVLQGMHAEGMLGTLAGLAAGLVAGGLTTPCDVVKTRMQTQTLQQLTPATPLIAERRFPKRSPSQGFALALDAADTNSEGLVTLIRGSATLVRGVDESLEPGMLRGMRTSETSVGAALRNIVEQEGLGALGAGFGPRVAKLAPGMAITMGIYEILQGLVAAFH